mmetsp:Transcript_49710/g.118466  ORF Transcript_49710/g.118466 Transcript_49710/m.118466 type:complete len:765 (+) Transcript_49710:79-2373(+)
MRSASQQDDFLPSSDTAPLRSESALFRCLGNELLCSHDVAREPMTAPLPKEEKAHSKPAHHHLSDGSSACIAPSSVDISGSSRVSSDLVLLFEQQAVLISDMLREQSQLLSSQWRRNFDMWKDTAQVPEPMSIIAPGAAGEDAATEAVISFEDQVSKEDPPGDCSPRSRLRIVPPQSRLLVGRPVPARLDDSPMEASPAPYESDDMVKEVSFATTVSSPSRRKSTSMTPLASCLSPVGKRAHQHKSARFAAAIAGAVSPNASPPSSPRSNTAAPKQQRNSLGDMWRRSRSSKSRTTQDFDEDDARKRLAKEISRTMGRRSHVVSAHDLDEVSFKERLRRFISTKGFDRLICLLTVGYAVYIGAQVQHTADLQQTESGLQPQHSVPYLIANTVFSCLLVLEVGLRILVDGSSFFVGEDWLWNVFDFIIMICSLADVVVSFAFEDEVYVSRPILITRMVRVFRYMRVVRLMRVMRFVRSLRLLVTTIVGTMRAGIWTLLLMSIFIYGFAVVFAQAAIDSQIDRDGSVSPVLLDRYGDLWKSAHTLFKSISGGLDWENALAPLQSLNWIYTFLFMGYITFTFFILMNVITGFFCNSAMEIARSDQELVTMEHVRFRKWYIAKLEQIFNAMDENNTGLLTVSDFERHFSMQNQGAYFASVLQIEAQDAWELFKFLDTDEDNVVNKQDFVEGCLLFRGQARSLDLHKLLREVKNQRKHLQSRVSEASVAGVNSFGKDRRSRTSDNRGRGGSEVSAGADSVLSSSDQDRN